VVQVNGYHVKRTKEVRDNSPAKSDSKDPQVIADLVWQGCYQELGACPSIPSCRQKKSLFTISEHAWM